MIITLGNARNALLVSDRRLTLPGGGHDDESNKAFVLTTRDARMAIGFAGLAEAATLRFKTRFWLAQALAEVAPPSHTIVEMLSRLKAKANREISPLRVTDKRLSITGVGYIYTNGQPRLAFFRLSNFESPDMQPLVADRAAHQFQEWTWWAEEGEPSAMLGNISGFFTLPPQAQSVWGETKELVRADKPPQAIVSRTVKLIRLTADDRKTQGSVGRQCMSVVISSDPTVQPTSRYHTSEVKATAYMPGIIDARGGPHPVLAVMDASFGAVDETIPTVVPEVPRNRPCPCGSGRKYKYCHGRVMKIKSRPGSRPA
ncbi:SEC-C domain-containing protein [Trebonia kvetii]|nr:SEC-C domain-containing protein [Trebonia kvetii]